MSTPNIPVFNNQATTGRTVDSPILVGTLKVGGDVNAPITIGHGNTVRCDYYLGPGTKVYLEGPPAIKKRDFTPKPPRVPIMFVGRENELRRLEQSIIKKEAVIVSGNDGVGKTFLVKKAANSKPATSMPDGVIFLEAVDENGNALGYQDIVQALFDALFESNPPYKVTSVTARTYLTNTRPFVILDRFELPPSSIKDLPDLFPKGSIIVTSRNTAFGNDAYQTVSLQPLAHADALQLLALRSNLNLNDPDQFPFLDQACVELNDVPLAIRIAANLIFDNRITIEGALAKLRNIQSNTPDKIRAAIERAYALAYSLLNTNEQDMLAYAASAPGISVDTAWLESVAGGPPTSRSLQALELLQANSPRLRLPDGMPQIVLKKRTDVNTLSHALLKKIIGELESQPFDFGYLSGELGNILGFIQIAFENERWSEVITLGKAIDPYLMLRGFWDVWEKLLNLMLRAGENLNDVATQSWALHQLGSREIGVGDSALAHKLLVHALRLRESAGDSIGAEFTRHNLGMIIPPPKNNGGQNGPGNSGGRINVRKFLPRNPAGWIALGGTALAAVAGLLYYLWIYAPTHRLDLSIQAQPMLHMDAVGDSIHYAYSIANNSNLPVEGPIGAISNQRDPIYCPEVETTGNHDNRLDTGETLICESEHPINPVDVKSGVVTNRARAESKDGIMSNRASTTTVLEERKPSISLTATADQSSYNHVDQVITYTYTIINTGNAILETQPQITDDRMKANCNLIDEKSFLIPQGIVTCNAQYTITQGDIDFGSVTSSAYADVDGIQSNKINLTIGAEIISGLALTFSANPTSYEKVDQVITYTYTVENQGNSTLNSILLLNPDTSKNSMCSPISTDGSSILPPKRTNQCASTYTVTQADLDAGSLTINAVATSGRVKSNPSTLTIYALQNPQLTLTSSANRTTYSHVGDAATYTYVVTNAGNVTLGPGQPGVSDKKILGEQLLPCGSELTVLPPGGTQTCLANYLVTIADIDAKNVINQATVKITDRGKEITSSSTTTTITLLCPPRPDGWATYVVKTEKSLDEISNRFGKTTAEIQDVNCMGSSISLYSGQKLYVPYLATIYGYVFNDNDSDKTKDPNEVFIGDFVVTISREEFGSNIATTTTNSNGEYSVTGLLPGEYWVLHSRVSVNSDPISGKKNFGLIPIP